ncbi:hypothetical protein GH714_023038 [Hevea brasiliensis]|uniref:Uncharacterized protein n=1 Tax=Hevea brasiliensis TaxID=3981 RepID=A0A6A6KQP6_HEVBR|nr:hypothetical protein GH714_023038 [Hevea brasiliensis]
MSRRRRENEDGFGVAKECLLGGFGAKRRGLREQELWPLVVFAEAVALIAAGTVNRTLFKTLAIKFSSMAVFTGTPLYGTSLLYAGPASMIWGWLAVTFFTWFVGIAMADICSSSPDPSYLYNGNNETGGALVPAQVIDDAFLGKYHNSARAVVFLSIIWESFFVCGLSVTNSAGRRQWNPIFTCVEKNTPQIQGSQKCGVALYSHRHYSWTTILKLDVIFTAIISISTIGWVGGYAVPILARLLMDEKNFKPGPLYLGRARRPICLVAFLWICYTCSAFLLPTIYPIRWKTFNYAPVAPGVCLSLIMLWWVLDARKWFKGLVRNIDGQHEDT